MLNLLICKCVLSLSLRPDHQETLLSLSAKMSEYQKQLADLPHTVKVKHPH